jgi:hypothetical protein
MDHTRCAIDEYQQVDGTAFADRICKPMTVCAAAEYESKAPALSATYGSGVFEKGTNVMPAFKGKVCQSYHFKTPFASVPRIIVTPTHRSKKHEDQEHQSVAAWTEWATLTSFRACVHELNRNDSHAKLNIDYFAWVGDAVGDAIAGTIETDKLPKETSCRTYTFAAPFASKPLVVGSVDHTAIDDAIDHDAITSWVESVQSTGFKACFTESAHSDRGAHSMVKFHFLAFEQGHFTALDARGRSAALAGGEKLIGRTCLWIDYGSTFLATPMVIATLNHHARTLTQGPRNSMQGWVENVETSRFKYCPERATISTMANMRLVYLWIGPPLPVQRRPTACARNFEHAKRQSGSPQRPPNRQTASVPL